MKKLKQLITCASIFALVISCNPKQNKSIETTQTDPNIIVIVADDLGYADIGITKLANDVYTPNIDRIATNGIRLNQTYVNSPICNQSRIGIMTGVYPQRFGSYWYSAEGLHDPNFKTIPELLKEKKYSTAYIGKVHYGDHDADISNRSFPLNHGFDYFFGHTSARKHYMNHKKEIEESFLKAKKKHNRKGQTLRQGPLWENKKPVDTIAFFTNLVGQKSRQFIKKNKEHPFFLQIAFNAAHNFTHQLPEEYLKRNQLKGYHDWNPEHEEYYDWYTKGRFPNNDEGREHYLGQVHYMDQEIGKLLDMLEVHNLLENTLIFFISDNGGSTPIYADNTPLRGSKYLLYEGGIRTQMLVSYPKKYKKGIVNQNMVSAMDILPTICEEVNIKKPENIDGISLSPLLNGENQTLQHEILFWDTGHEIAVRKGDWKLRKSFNDEEAKYEMVDLELGEFLHNLKNDEGELKNQITKEAQTVQELNDLYINWKDYVSGN